MTFNKQVLLPIRIFWETLKIMGHYIKLFNNPQYKNSVAWMRDLIMMAKADKTWVVVKIKAQFTIKLSLH